MTLLLKLIAQLFYPLGMGMGLIVVGVVLTLLNRRNGWRFSVAGATVLFCMSLPVVAQLIVRPLEAPYFVAKIFPRDCPAIVVLGGCGKPLGAPRIYPEISEAGDRLLHAARLYKRGIAPRIITTGGTNVGEFYQTVTEGEHNAMLLREIGVDSAAILIETKSLTTADHGPLIGALLDSLMLPRRIVLVTSATHMRRAVWVFKKYGFEVYPAATDFMTNYRLIRNIRDFFPSVGSLSDVTSAVHEYYGLIGYRILQKG